MDEKFAAYRKEFSIPGEQEWLEPHWTAPEGVEDPWARHDGIVRHFKSEFRGPAFEGDVTCIDDEVIARQEKSEWGFPMVQVKAFMTNQNGSIVVTSVNEVELPYS